VAEIENAWRGPNVPSFIAYMDSEAVKSIVETALEGSNAFLVDLEISDGNNIGVFADTDEGIKINELKSISREIEAALDREIEDFALTVSSPGLDRPLKLHRQYVNNVGRWVKVKTTMPKTIKGELINVDREAIKIRIPHKKRKEPAVEESIDFAEIIETKIQVRF
jgi:ribosome maturation factor RimP